MKTATPVEPSAAGPPRGRARRMLVRGLALVIGVYVVTAYTLRGLPRVAVDAMEHADACELLSLDPGRPSFDPAFAGERLGHWAIVGRTPVAPADRQQLLDGLQFSNRWFLHLPSLCFSPRHAVRVTRGGQTTDLLVCFECSQAQVWQGGAKAAEFLVGDGPRATFDALLDRAGVPRVPGNH